MTIILGLMAAGIITGLFLDKFPRIVRISDKLLSLAIYGLLLLLGMAVGANEKIISNIFTLGFQALVITAGAIAGSVFFCWIIYKAFFHLK